MGHATINLMMELLMVYVRPLRVLYLVVLAIVGWMLVGPWGALLVVVASIDIN